MGASSMIQILVVFSLERNPFIELAELNKFLNLDIILSGLTFYWFQICKKKEPSEKGKSRWIVQVYKIEEDPDLRIFLKE